MFFFCVSFSTVLEDLLRKIMSRREGFGEARHVMREILLKIYEEALSSNCKHMVQMIQVNFLYYFPLVSD